MRYDATTYIILRYLHANPDSSVEEIAKGTGIPAYIVKHKLTYVARTKSANIA